MTKLILSGLRVVEWLNEDSTYPQLQSNIKRTFPNTRARENSPTPPRVTNIRYTPHVGNSSLEIDANTSGTNTNHQTTVLVTNVSFEQADAPNNVTVTTSGGGEQSLKPINLANSTIKVRCTCMDFRFRFAVWNFNDNSLIGSKPPPYVATSNRPPVNPLKTPGVCKHIIQTIRSAQQAGVLV